MHLRSFSKMKDSVGLKMLFGRSSLDSNSIQNVVKQRKVPGKCALQPNLVLESYNGSLKTNGDHWPLLFTIIQSKHSCN